MRRNRSLPRWLVSCAMLLAVHGAHASNMVVVWADPVGDFGPVGDAVSAKLVFDSNSGDWTATWEASGAHPFTGNAQFNLNLFDTALGNAATAAAPQVSLDTAHDFGTSTAMSYSYSGKTSFLAEWHVGDQVWSGNNQTFLSGVVGADSPWGRDNLLSLGTIAAAVPEPGTYAMILAGLGVMGFVGRRGKRT